MTDSWLLDGESVEVGLDWQVMADRLVLSLRVGRDELDVVRRYDTTDEVVIRSSSDGDFVAVWMGEGDGTVTVTPPEWMRPPLETDDWLPVAYDEQQIAPDAYRVELEFQATRPRDGVYDAVDAEPSAAYVVDLERGRLAFDDDAVSTTVREASPVGGDVTVTLKVTADEAATLIDTLTRPMGVIEYHVRPGSDLLVDESGTMGLFVDTPDIGAFQTGDYIAREWELTQSRAADLDDLYGLLVEDGETVTVVDGQTVTERRTRIDRGGTLIQEQGSTLETTGPHADDAVRYTAEVRLTPADVIGANASWLVVHADETYTLDDGDGAAYTRTTVRRGGRIEQARGSTLTTTG